MSKDKKHLLARAVNSIFASALQIRAGDLLPRGAAAARRAAA